MKSLYTTKQTNKLVVDIIGFPGRGKSSVCALLAQAGFTIMRPSDIIRAYAAAVLAILKNSKL